MRKYLIISILAGVMACFLAVPAAYSDNKAYRNCIKCHHTGDVKKEKADKTKAEGDPAASKEAAHDCMTCHQIAKEEIAKMLKEGLNVPAVKILDIRPAPVKGLWEVVLEADSGKVIAYVDISKQSIIFGNIIAIKTRKNLTGERLYELNKVDVSQIPLGDALVMGDKNAKHKVIVFDDPE